MYCCLKTNLHVKKEHFIRKYKFFMNGFYLQFESIYVLTILYVRSRAKGVCMFRKYPEAFREDYKKKYFDEFSTRGGGGVTPFPYCWCWY